VSLPRFLQTMLDEHMASLPGGDDTLVFATPSGTPIRHGLLYRRRFKPAVYAALPPELHGLRFHDLRHTAASLSISQGAHPLLLKQRLGHSSIEIPMDRYGHLFPSAEQALCAGLDAAYDASSSSAANVVALDSARP